MPPEELRGRHILKTFALTDIHGIFPEFFLYFKHCVKHIPRLTFFKLHDDSLSRHKLLPFYIEEVEAQRN